MKSNRLMLQVFAVAAGLILLGGLGFYWPRWVGADSGVAPGVAPASEPVALEAVIGEAFTYQGFLTNENDSPLTGNYTMRFLLFTASNGGALRWNSGDMNVPVKDGLFAVRLAPDADLFNGEGLWIEQIVGGQALSPRQEILPAPMALTVRPGAIIKGTASAISNNYAVEVNFNNDAFAFNRGAITGQTTTGNAIYGLAQNGRAVYGQTENGYAVYGFDGGSNANQGYAGYFYSTNGIGVYGYSGANRTHPNILAPGVYGQSNQGVGVYGRGDTSNSFTFFNQGGYFEGGKGLYARGTDSSGEQGYGAQIYSNNYRGMLVQGGAGWFDAYFNGDTGISAFGYTDRSAASQSLVVNLGTVAIAPGDLVALAGVAESPENGQPILGVERINAGNRHAVIGVALATYAAETRTPGDDSDAYVDFSPVAGHAAAGGYLSIITDGLAPAVNVSQLTSGAVWAIGDKIALAANGELRLAVEAADGPVIGKVAGPIDERTGTVPLFVDID